MYARGAFVCPRSGCGPSRVPAGALPKVHHDGLSDGGLGGLTEDRRTNRRKAPTTAKSTAPHRALDGEHR